MVLSDPNSSKRQKKKATVNINKALDCYEQIETNRMASLPILAPITSISYGSQRKETFKRNQRTIERQEQGIWDDDATETKNEAFNRVLTEVAKDARNLPKQTRRLSLPTRSIEDKYGQPNNKRQFKVGEIIPKLAGIENARE